MTALTDIEISTALGALAGWTRDGDTLVAAYRRQDWTDALGFVNRIAEEAERRDHHPDLCVTGYRSVTIRLTTHSEGGITHRDINLARWIQDAAAAPVTGQG